MKKSFDRGDWIQTYTGKQFFPQDPRPAEICIEDIAHSLSLQCRFNGHTSVFYSVAQHSVQVSHLVPSEHALWGLMHDAAEAYLKDIPRPVKKAIPEYKTWENQLMSIIAQKYGLCWPEPAEIKVADNIMLATEARDLMTRPPNTWELLPEPVGHILEPVSWIVAKQMFLNRWEELTRHR